MATFAPTGVMRYRSPWPDGTGCDLTAPTRFDQLFTTSVNTDLPDYIEALVGDTRGTEAIEADAERTLKNVKLVASPPGDAPYMIPDFLVKYGVFAA